MNYFHEKLPDIGQKFVAIWDDGSGARLFKRLDDNYNGELFVNEDGDEAYDIESYGHVFWLPIPNNFALWFEGREE